MQEVTFQSGGDPVRGLLHHAEGDAAGALVLVHGFLSRSEEFADAGERLAALGWNVLTFDQRGFGKSGGERGTVSLERAAEDVRSAVAYLKEQKLTTNGVGLIGHSMGTVFVSAAARTLPDVRALVQVAPLRTVKSELSDAEFRMYMVGRNLSHLKARIGLGHLTVPYKNRYEDLFKDPAAAAKAKELAFLEPKVSLSNVDALLRMDGERVARQVTLPTMVVICEHDKVVRPENSRAVYDAFAGPKDLLHLDCGHSAFGDCEAKRLHDGIDQWMRRYLGA